MGYFWRSLPEINPPPNQTSSPWNFTDGITVSSAGATAPTRYVGGTTSGAPTTNTAAFSVGDFVIDQTGEVWICTIAGAPGSWTAPGLPLTGGIDTVTCLSGVVPSYASMPRILVSGSQSVLTSQEIFLIAVLVPAGVSLSHLGFRTGTTAAVSPSHWWMVLASSALEILGVTADQTTAAIGTSSSFSVPMAANVTVPGTGGVLQLLYAGLMVDAGTVPTIEGVAAPQQSTTAPPVLGTSGSGLTTPPAAGSTLATLGTAQLPWPYFWAY